VTKKLLGGEGYALERKMEQGSLQFQGVPIIVTSNAYPKIAYQESSVAEWEAI